MISLKSLIAALSRAFSTAQDELAWSQLAALKTYFHDDLSPKTLNLQIPKIDTEELSYEPFKAPLLSLIPPKPLNITEAKLSFSVSIGEIKSEQITGPTNRQLFLEIGKHDLGGANNAELLPFDLEVDPNTLGQKDAVMKIEMKVKQENVEDGYERLIAKLSQLQGSWPSKNKTQSTETLKNKTNFNDAKPQDKTSNEDQHLSTTSTDGGQST